MRFLRVAYLDMASEVPSTEQFVGLLEKTNLQDGNFTTETYQPGTSGESFLYRTLVETTKIQVD